MSVFLILSAVAGLLWLAVSGKAAWRQRARSAEKQNKAVQDAQNVKNTVARDRDYRQRVRDHFDAP